MALKKSKSALKILFSILFILVLGLAYINKINKNFLTDCHESIYGYMNPSWGPGPDGVDVEDKVICQHNTWYKLNPFN